jgi:ketosteroid isomerase-like protein
MNQILRAVTLLTCLLSASGLSADTRSEILTALDYYAEVWNEGDLDSVKSYYHPDFVAIGPDGMVTRAQRMESLEILIKPGEDRGEISYSGVIVEPLEQKHALAYGHLRVSFKDGTELDTWFSTVYARTPFGWKALLTHN